MKRIDQLAGVEKKDRSAITRELISGGLDYLMIRRYKEGRLSLGKLAERTGRSLADTLDLLAGLGVPAPIDYADYLRGFQNLGLKRLKPASR